MNVNLFYIFHAFSQSVHDYIQQPTTIREEIEFKKIWKLEKVYINLQLKNYINENCFNFL